VYRVLNPPEIVRTNYFHLETFSASGWLIDGKYNIPGIQIVKKLDVGQIEHVDFSADPSNGGMVADLTVTFKPSISYP
jgi:hypothetical protein